MGNDRKPRLTFEEVLLCIAGVLSFRSLIVVFICNFWGHFDASLRYPIVHDLDSFFALKQLFLVLLKTAGYLLGFREVTKNLGWAVLALLVNVCTVPIIWLTALPIGDVNSYHQKHDVLDEDLAIRIWCTLTVSTERAAAVARFKATARKALAGVAKAVPMLKPAALRIDPTLVRILKANSV
ncbi:unnamed protein product [Symbiodinium pilosum]|uniref:Uncharacterized protein n=1 Tax=Symbiodinium pilosum TaxID=2952 RepID=A0A812SMS0_SYMPI|nr:unnamed protein product [Symbiodinium pilosum]